MVGSDPNSRDDQNVGASEPVSDDALSAALPVEAASTVVIDLGSEADRGPEIAREGPPRRASSSGAGTTARLAPDDEEEEPVRRSSREMFASVVKNAPPWLVSTVFHMVVLIVLGLWVIGAETNLRLILRSTSAERLGEQTEIETFDFNSPDETIVDEPIFTPQDLPLVEDPLAVPTESEVTAWNELATSQLDAPTIGQALTGRERGMKEALLSAFGGDETTETAVLNGLKWLARQQRRDGSWSLVSPYPNGAFNENRSAAAGMALLAFQGAGYTHRGSQEEPFTKVVTDGWRWLIKQQDSDGNFFRGRVNMHRFYTHAICTIAICELYAMTGDETYREPAQRAVDFLVRSQDSAGGWRYTPGVDSDLSVTGWVVMALQSARMAYLDVPDETLENVSSFLDDVAVPDTSRYSKGSRYVYKVGRAENMAMTAEGLLCRQYLGWARNDSRLLEGVDLITENLPNWKRRNVYYWYYAAQVCHHMEGEPWKKWNAVMRQLIPEKQVRRGAQRGSWDIAGDAWGAQGGGRLFVTCLSIYMLEVYYRHLPLYQQRLFDGG